MVELGPDQPGELTVLDADESGHSTQSFRPASQLTYNIRGESSAGEV